MTITRLENNRSGGYAVTLTKIQRAFEAAGIEFLDGEAPGIRLRLTKRKKR
jgi:hypothetical protein